ncbi:MAG TPA: hypothetical protein VGE74_22520 [Gemmata sp.]
MADVVLFFCPQCDSCRHLTTAPADERVRCIACDTFFPHTGRVFGAAEWQTATDPVLMATVLAEFRQPPTDRKWRLLSCAIARTEFDWCRNPWFLDALAAAETWADAGQRPRAAGACADHFARSTDWSRRREHAGWMSLARRLTRDDPRPRLDDLPQWRTLSAALLRELVPNPFRPVIRNPDWLTSNVVSLAAHIDRAHEFATMPILADALQDTGCGDKRVLNHCRAIGPHVRGCWVLDMILGKE